MSKFEKRLDQTLSLILNEEVTREPGVKKPNCSLSEKQINEHYDNHYKAYLSGYSEARRRLLEISTLDPDYRSVLLDLSFNYNGIVLHELYFSCLGRKEMSSEMSELVNKTFGSQKKLEQHLKAALMSSRGWVVLSHDIRQDELILNIIDDHDIHAMIAHPILALDAWEHAYYIDYQSDKEKYVDLIIQDINWEAVEEHTLKIEDGHSVSRTTI